MSNIITGMLRFPVSKSKIEIEKRDIEKVNVYLRVLTTVCVALFRLFKMDYGCKTTGKLLIQF